MDANAPGDLSRWFGDWEDPRPGHPVMHPLADVLAIAILAVLCGADSWVDAATFGRVFGWLNPIQFEKCFMKLAISQGWEIPSARTLRKRPFWWSRVRRQR